MLAEKNTDIGNAYNLLKIISKDEKARMAYEAREAELMDQRTRVRSALAKGKAEIIHALLRGGMGVDETASMAGMEKKEVEQIQKGISSSLADTK